MLEIVLVDDAREDSLLADRVLRQHCKLENPITHCRSGDEAIALIDARAATGTPFLMFLDLIMAPTSGLDVLEYWRNLKQEGKSVVVMVSGLNDLVSIHEGYQRGATTFVLKPLNREDMLDVLKGLSACVGIERTAEGYLLKWTGTSCVKGTERPPVSDRSEITFPA